MILFLLCVILPPDTLYIIVADFAIFITDFLFYQKRKTDLLFQRLFKSPQNYKVLLRILCKFDIMTMRGNLS